MSILITQNESNIYILLIVTALVSLVLLEGGSFSAEGPTDVQAVSDLRIKVSMHEDEVERGDTQKVTVTVSDKDDRDVKITDAKVKLTVYPPQSDSTTADDKTDSDGEANFKVKIDDDAELGTYDVKIKASKSGYDTETEESSFDVVGSSSSSFDDKDDDHNNSDDDGGNDKKGAKDNKNDDDRGDNAGDNDDNNGDDDSNDSDDGDQTISQGNACGNGLLSTNVLCQNVANQLQVDGNAINIIALQADGNEKTKMGTSSGGGGGGHLSNPSLSSPASSPAFSSPSSFPSSPNVLGGQDRTSSLSNDESLASIVDDYKQARINKAIELRMNYLR